MGWLTVTIVFLSDASARPFGTKKVPNSIRQIMPVNILRYMVKSPFLDIRAAKFITPRNLVREIEKHSGCQTASKTTAGKATSFQCLKPVAHFSQTANLRPRVRTVVAVSELWSQPQSQRRALRMGKPLSSETPPLRKAWQHTLSCS